MQLVKFGLLIIWRTQKVNQFNLINDVIPPEFCYIKYKTIDDSIYIFKNKKKNSKGALVFTTDIENAFKIIPVHPSDNELLGW